MSKISQEAPGTAVPPKPSRLAVSSGWLAGAARALGFAAPEPAGGRSFDFTAMRRSLDSLQRKTSGAGE